MYQNLHFYIDLDWAKNIESPTYIKDLTTLVLFAYQHKASVYYCQSQLEEFTKQLNDLDENYITSNGNALQLILLDAIRLKEESYVFEVCFAHSNTSLRPIENKILRTIKNKDKQAIFSFSNEPQNLLLIKSNSEFEKITVSYVNEIKSLKDWIIQNCENRTFSLSRKHGSQDKKAFVSNKNESVSQLLCTEEEASHLLNNAIADFEIKDARLFNWDEMHNTYIEFFFEGNLMWHGFHLNKSDWHRVPESIKKHFNK